MPVVFLQHTTFPHPMHVFEKSNYKLPLLNIWVLLLLLLLVYYYTSKLFWKSACKVQKNQSRVIWFCSTCKIKPILSGGITNRSIFLMQANLSVFIFVILQLRKMKCSQREESEFWLIAFHRIFANYFSKLFFSQSSLTE